MMHITWIEALLVKYLLWCLFCSFEWKQTASTILETELCGGSKSTFTRRRRTHLVLPWFGYVKNKNSATHKLKRKSHWNINPWLTLYFQSFIIGVGNNAVQHFLLWHVNISTFIVAVFISSLRHREITFYPEKHNALLRIL